MRVSNVSGKRLGLIQCPVCHLVCRHTSMANDGLCPRCHTRLSFRKSASLAKTWAFLLAAGVFYIPANVLIMTHASSAWGTQSDTILSGVVYFMNTGMWSVALIILVASVVVPLLKMVILLILLISVMRHSRHNAVLKTRLYRVTEIIGRWSMVDVYVVTILVALVNMGAIASVKAGPAAIYFCLVVLLTMAAAASFDPRLIWDELECDNE